MKKLLFGVGVNDADYNVTSRIDGKISVCIFYQTWKHMLERCYSAKYQKTRPSYSGCVVCREWIAFSNFRNWMIAQDWEGKQLDKDIIVKGNKIYHPERCSFVTHAVNSFVTAAGLPDGSIGVSWIGKLKKHSAKCGNPFTGKSEYLGLFECSHDAHAAWKKRKHELACQLAEIQTDERVANALRNRYL